MNAALRCDLERGRFVKRLPRSLCNIEDVRQLVRSSGSIGANYIEANESLSKKDFLMRIRIARKEAKESGMQYFVVEQERYDNTNPLKAAQDDAAYMKKLKL